MCFCHVRPSWQPVRTAGTLPSMPARLLCFLHTFGRPRQAGAVDLVSPAEPEQPAKPTIDQRLLRGTAEYRAFQPEEHDASFFTNAAFVSLQQQMTHWKILALFLVSFLKIVRGYLKQSIIQ